jgi:CHAD domain-containing protein
MQTHIEHELKLDAPPGFELPALGGEPLESRLFTSVYYDVPGGSLADAGITLRRRTERGKSVWQLKLPAADSRLELEVPGGPARVPEELTRLLAAHLRHGPPAPVAELRTRRRGQLVERSGTSAEVTVDEVAVMDAQRVASAFVEIEIELRAGNPKRLDAIARRLAGAGAERSDGLPKLFRVLGRNGAAAGPPDGPFEALRTLLRKQLREIHAHDPGTRHGEDPESLHDMRVAVRRSRALLRAGRELVATDTAELDRRLQELGAALGAVRDLDVLLERLRAEAAALDGVDGRSARVLLRALARERTRDRRVLLRRLGSPAYLELLDDFGRTIDELRPTGAEVSLDELAGRAFKKARRAARALGDDPPDDDLHALRKLGKRARYAAELAGKDEVVRRAKQLQDVLGDHQDAVVAEERLRILAAGAPAEQAFAAGRLVEREHARKRAARASWEQAWRRLERAAR